mgnify:CR=1 FL=1
MCTQYAHASTTPYQVELQLKQTEVQSVRYRLGSSGGVGAVSA